MKFKLVEDVIGAFDEFGAAPDQRMTAPGKRIVDRTRDGKHLASLRAGLSEPLWRAASTTSVPRHRPLIIRLRRAKLALIGGEPGGYSLTSAPWAAMRAARVA